MINSLDLSAGRGRHTPGPTSTISSAKSTPRDPGKPQKPRASNEQIPPPPGFSSTDSAAGEKAPRILLNSTHTRLYFSTLSKNPPCSLPAESCSTLRQRRPPGLKALPFPGKQCSFTLLLSFCTEKSHRNCICAAAAATSRSPSRRKPGRPPAPVSPFHRMCDRSGTAARNLPGGAAKCCNPLPLVQNIPVPGVLETKEGQKASHESPDVVFLPPARPGAACPRPGYAQ